MFNKKTIILPLLVAMLSAAVSTGCGSRNKPNGVYHNESNVGYQLLVYSFNDSDGDGRGDIKGITQKLDYFVDLGVNVLWLSPINKAGSYHGYDVQDYYSVSNKLGTEEDLKELIKEAHKKDIKILLDMVVNHTSNSHPWFVEARRDANSKYRNYYVFKESGVQYGNSSNTSAGWYKNNNLEYYSSFSQSMPDLNLSHPDVRKEVENIFNYWIDFGVDGFRLDAIKHFFDGKEYSSVSNVKEMTASFFKELNTAMKKKNPNIFFVGEWLDESYIPYLTSAPYIDSQFSFASRKALLATASGSNSGAYLATNITKEINKQLELNPDFTYTPIIGNHDHDRIASSYGFSGSSSKLRLRLATQMLLTLPGMPFIYSGDELGMTGSRYNNDDIERRLPFLWGEGNEVNPDTYGKGKYRTQVLNERTSLVDAKLDKASLFNLYKDILKVRKNNRAFAGGKMSVFGDDTNSNVVAYTIESKGQKLLIAHCVKNQAGVLDLAGVSLGKEVYSTYSLNEYKNDLEKDADGNYTYSKSNTYSIKQGKLNLNPYSTVIFEVKR